MTREKLKSDLSRAAELAVGSALERVAALLLSCAALEDELARRYPQVASESKDKRLPRLLKHAKTHGDLSKSERESAAEAVRARNRAIHAGQLLGAEATSAHVGAIASALGVCVPRREPQRPDSFSARALPSFADLLAASTTEDDDLRVAIAALAATRFELEIDSASHRSLTGHLMDKIAATANWWTGPMRADLEHATRMRNDMVHEQELVSNAMLLRTLRAFQRGAEIAAAMIAVEDAARARAREDAIRAERLATENAIRAFMDRATAELRRAGSNVEAEIQASLRAFENTTLIDYSLRGICLGATIANAVGLIGLMTWVFLAHPKDQHAVEVAVAVLAVLVPIGSICGVLRELRCRKRLANELCIEAENVRLRRLSAHFGKLASEELTRRFNDKDWQRFYAVAQELRVTQKELDGPPPGAASLPEVRAQAWWIRLALFVSAFSGLGPCCFFGLSGGLALVADSEHRSDAKQGSLAAGGAVVMTALGWVTILIVLEVFAWWARG